MKRNCSLNEISDGNLYGPDDLVEVNCNGCKGHATCCHGMGSSIVLDPYDIYRLTTNLAITFEELLRDRIQLNVVDGIILPNLKMKDTTESCAFLEEDGRCSIHAHRPGICRIFPLGRYYEDHSFKYILQINECGNSCSTKRKVSNWIDTQDRERNEQFLIDWHYFLNDVEEVVRNAQDENHVRNLNMFVLNRFYVKKYEAGMDFYGQFYERLDEVKRVLEI